MMDFAHNKRFIMGLAGVFLAISAWLTGCMLKENKPVLIDSQKYIEAKAIVKERIPGRVTRYGAQQPRLTIEIIKDDGSTITRGNIQFNKDFNQNDTITIWYNPADPNSELFLEKP